MAQVERLHWRKCEGNQWCNLFRLNLAHPHFDGLYGVFVVWLGGLRPRTLAVGHGPISEKLQDLRQRWAGRDWPADVFVTWAIVSEDQAAIVAQSLAAGLEPAEMADFVPAPVSGAVGLYVNPPW